MICTLIASSLSFSFSFPVFSRFEVQLIFLEKINYPHHPKSKSWNAYSGNRLILFNVSSDASSGTYDASIKQPETKPKGTDILLTLGRDSQSAYGGFSRGSPGGCGLDTCTAADQEESM